MQTNKSTNAAFLIVLFVAAIIGISDVVTRKEQSEEGHLMAVVREDIKLYETFRAEADIDELISIITTHTNRLKDHDDPVVQKTIVELEKLKDEAIFRNTYLDVYNSGFTHVLNELSYLSLVEALGFLKVDKYREAIGSVETAEEYLHDAIMFSSKENQIENEKMMLRELAFIKRHLEPGMLEQFVSEIKQKI